MMRLVCTSHSPLLLSVTPADRQRGEEFFAAIERVRRSIEAWQPELVVIFAPDHFNGFFYGVMPPFCIGTAARSSVDWDLEPGALAVPKALAAELCDAIRAAGIDIALSHRMTVDHGTVIPLRLMTGRLDGFPTIPIFIDCAAPPLPSCARARMLGEAVGHFLSNTGRRILVIGSGGLSHDPPHPGFEEASPEARELLINAHAWTEAHERARQDRVVRAARALVAGGGPCLPPNPAWDRHIMALLGGGSFDALDALTEAEIESKGGSGGQEIRTWIAAFAALGAAGPFESEELFYAAIPEWITGMGIVAAWNANDVAARPS